MQSVPYDYFTNAFLSKISEFDFWELDNEERQYVIDGYMKRAIAGFRSICLYDFSTTCNDGERVFNVTVPDDEIDELTDIISDGMLVQWLKPYIYKQEGLENVLSTRDFTTYSPANLLSSLREFYAKSQRDYTNKMREYSYQHGDLTVLHL